MTTFTGLDETRATLERMGFRIYANFLFSAGSRCNWIACKRTDIPSRHCDYNDGKPVQIVVRPFHMEFMNGTASRSLEIDIAAEAGGQWFKLQAYSIQPEGIEAKLPAIERALVAAWNAINPDDVRGEA